MEKIKQALMLLRDMNEKYGLPNDNVEAVQAQTVNASVCMPLIGKFSSGKSALLNSVLDYENLLSENIGPETAVPTELCYAEEYRIIMEENDGSLHEIEWADYQEMQPDPSTVRCFRMELANDILREIPDVVLVDMPGFESGIEVHNRAIDSYVSRSLAYLIVFPADNMVLSSSMSSFLLELCQHDMPICVVITKCDKCNSEFAETFAALKTALHKLMGDRAITFCRTSSRANEVEELRNYLHSIERQSQSILEKSFRGQVLSEANVTAAYLKSTLEGSQLSESELKEEEERKKHELDELGQRFEDNRRKFQNEIYDCVELIRGDVLTALQAQESEYIELALNKQDIRPMMNITVRRAVTQSLKKNFISKLEKYLNGVNSCVTGDSVSDVDVQISVDVDKIMKNAVSSTVAGVTGLLLMGPIIGGIAAALVKLANCIGAGKKREKAKQEIRMELNTKAYPKIQMEVGSAISKELEQQMRQIDADIQQKIDRQSEVLEKALQDLQDKQREENTQRAGREEQLRADLDTVQALIDSL
nr:dynamin family protein [uncultured Agathobaculum sp.]